MKKITALLPLFVFLFSQAQQINIIPKPVELKTGKGNFIITKTTAIVTIGNADQNSVDFLNSYLKQFYGFTLPVKDKITKNCITISTKVFIMPPSTDGYNLNCNADGIFISGDTHSGTFYGIQTLIQLLPVPNIDQQTSNIKLTIPQLVIRDYPKFPYRGMHLDCGRHFFSIDFVKKYIDWIALHKMNYFHWHLTEDQGWRIEIKKYPKLTEVGAWRNGTIIGRYPGKGNDGLHYGGYYTQEQIKDIVQYAADRFITIIPEIEMPGHCSAAIAAYPELSCFPDEPTIKYYPKQCAWSGDSSGKQVQQTWGVFNDVYCAGKENTFKFLEDVLDEVIQLFPSKYIHVGGDECPKENWKRCPLCQKRIKEEGLKNEHELQSYFIQRIEKYVNSKGRSIIGWDEILEGGLAPNATVMSWRGEQGGIDAARQNHDVVMTPGGWCYFDHSQSENEDSVTIGGYLPIEKVYSYNPVPDSLNAEQAKHILGAQGNVWTEYIGNEKKAEYMVFPRIAALSEVLWSEKKDSTGFEKRLMTQLKRYDLWKINYSKAYFDLKGTVSPTKNYNGVLWTVTTNSKNIPIKYDITKLDDSKTGWTVYPPIRKIYNAPIVISTSSNILAGIPERNSFISQVIHFNKATGKKITLTDPPSKSYSSDGAFTLVNGIQNEKGTARSKEFLGFSGTDCEAVIDLGKLQPISFVVVHTLKQEASWIYQPLTSEVFGSGDGKKFYSLKLTDDFVPNANGNGNGTMTMAFKQTYVRYVKVAVKNWGTIPADQPGAGNKAWLFVDEIEVN